MSAPGERAGTGWEMPCELSRGRASVLGFQPHIPTLGPCGAQEEEGGKMKGFDGTNRVHPGWRLGQGGSGPQWSLCGAPLHPCPRQRGRDQGGGAQFQEAFLCLIIFLLVQMGGFPGPFLHSLSLAGQALVGVRFPSQWVQPGMRFRARRRTRRDSPEP